MAKEYSSAANALHNIITIHKKKSKTEKDKEELYLNCVEMAQYLINLYPSITITKADFYDFRDFLAENLYILASDVSKTVYGKASMYYTYIKSVQEYNRVFLFMRDDKADMLFDPSYARRYVQSCDPQSITKLDVVDTLIRVCKGSLEFLRSTDKIKSPIDKCNAKISLLLSIRSGHFISFRLPKSIESLVRFVYNRFKKTWIDTLNDMEDSEIIPLNKLIQLSISDYSDEE